MIKFSRANWVRILTSGLMMASVGFCYATGSRGGVRDGSAPEQTGNPQNQSATDGNGPDDGQEAASRAGSPRALDTGTDYTTLQLKIKGTTAKDGTDSITFKGVANLNGVSTHTLKLTPFIIKINGKAYAGQLDFDGNIVDKFGNKPVIFPDGTQMTGVVDSQSGRISGVISHTTLAAQLGAITLVDHGTKKLTVQVTIGNFVSQVDTVELVTLHKGDKYSLSYLLGKTGRHIGGAFQILSAGGADHLNFAGVASTIWNARFLAIPRFGVDLHPGFDAINTVVVRIGNFTQTIPGANFTVGKGGLKMNKVSLSAEVVSILTINTTTFVGTMQTLPLSQKITGYQTATSTDTINVVPAGLIPNVKGNGNGKPDEDAVLPFAFGIDVNRTGTNESFTGNSERFLQPFFLGPLVALDLKVPPTTVRNVTAGFWVDRLRKLP